MQTAKLRARESSQFLTSAQVAAALGVTKRTLHNWIKSGKITAPEVNPANRYYRWTLVDVEAIRTNLRAEQ